MNFQTQNPNIQVALKFWIFLTLLLQSNDESQIHNSVVLLLIPYKTENSLTFTNTHTKLQLNTETHYYFMLRPHPILTLKIYSVISTFQLLKK